MNQETMVIAQGTDASTMDPHAHSETTTANILLQVYDALVRRNAEMEIEPWLAESWQVISDTVLEFKLRQGVSFHNGEIFDAETVKFSLERMVDPDRDPKFPPYGRFNSIERVEVIDPYTVHVYTNRPDPNLLAQLAGLMIIPPRYIQEHGEAYFARVPNGTGPFRFVSWDREAKVVDLTANQQYWHGKPVAQKLVFQAIPESRERVQGLLDGTIDLVANFPPLSREEVNGTEHVMVLETPSVGIIYMGINTHHPVLKNPKLRQAMAHAINVQELIDLELNGCGVPLSGPVYPQAFGVDKELEPIPYDLAYAKQLLVEAGFADGVKVKLEAPDGRFTQDKYIAQRISEQLKEVGIELEVDVQPWEPFIRRFRDHEYDQMYYVGWGNFTFDPDEVYRNAFLSPNPWNPTDFHHQRLAEIAIEASRTLDQERRKAIYKEACQIFRDQLPWIPLFQQIDLYGLNTKYTWKPRMDEFIYVFDIELNQ